MSIEKMNHAIRSHAFHRDYVLTKMPSAEAAIEQLKANCRAGAISQEELDEAIPKFENAFHAWVYVPRK
jgi:hypothetical protein